MALNSGYYIQDYFSIKANSFSNSDSILNGNLEKDTISKILGKPKEEVKDIEVQLLQHLFYNGTFSSRGNNITDNDYINRLQNVYKYIEKGLTIEDAIEASWKTPEEEKNKNIDGYYIQDYFSIMLNNFANPELTLNGSLERETISKILAKPKENVTDLEILLLKQIFYTGTVYKNGNNISDSDYKRMLNNLQSDISKGLSQEQALEMIWQPHDEIKYSTDYKIEPSNSKLQEFKNKYPSLFDSNGNLKDNSYELFDLLITKYNPKLVQEEKKEEVSSLFK